MCALRERVNACIRSPGPVDAHEFAGDALKRVLQMILNSVAMRLALPPGERHAVVRYDHFKSSGHGNVAIVVGDQQTVIRAKLLITHHRSLITFPFRLHGAFVEIALQNHLRRDLVHVPACVPSFFACISQCAVRCGGG